VNPTWLQRNVGGILLTLSVLALCCVSAGVLLLWGHAVALLVGGGLVMAECLAASTVILTQGRRPPQ